MDAAEFIRGDVDGTGVLDMSDPLLLLTHLFLGRPATCQDALDVDDDGALSITDAILELVFLFLGDFIPSPPFPGCGLDETRRPSRMRSTLRLYLSCTAQTRLEPCRAQRRIPLRRR
jgi:hypothetical protein